MMRIDTSHLSGWEDRFALLEFQHDSPTTAISPRFTEARLVEYVTDADRPKPLGTEWMKVSSGWKRMLCSAVARCSPEDQFCKETGRRVALRRLAAFQGRATYSRLRKAAIRQYFEDRARRRKAA